MANRDDKLPQSDDDNSEHGDRFDETLDISSVPAGDSKETRSLEASSGAIKNIGPYKLLQKLGEGGMGTVWMAEQQEPVRRRVALKLIKTGVDNKQVSARFEAERQAVAMMNHENIAKILDAGTTETGQPYFVMELVQGIPFNKYCDKNNLSIRDRLELFIPVCKAVQHAHQKGIIHRDLKPSNVLVCLYDGVAVPKVIDFGLAKALEPTTHLTDKTMFTEFGQVVGTLQYMSPEQAEMNQLDIDTRTDIYSLGVMLYELLTGSTPIAQDSLKGAAILNVLMMIRETEPLTLLQAYEEEYLAQSENEPDKQLEYANQFLESARKIENSLESRSPGNLKKPIDQVVCKLFRIHAEVISNLLANPSVIRDSQAVETNVFRNELRQVASALVDLEVDIESFLILDDKIIQIEKILVAGPEQKAQLVEDHLIFLENLERGFAEQKVDWLTTDNLLRLKVARLKAEQEFLAETISLNSITVERPTVSNQYLLRVQPSFADPELPDLICWEPFIPTGQLPSDFSEDPRKYSDDMEWVLRREKLIRQAGLGMLIRSSCKTVEEVESEIGSNDDAPRGWYYRIHLINEYPRRRIGNFKYFEKPIITRNN